MRLDGSAAAAVVVLLATGCVARPAPLTVSVAASLVDVLADLAHRYEAATGTTVQVNAGASNTLARQIVDGAPVDCFISADAAQMKVAVDAGRVVAGSEVALLTNQLVVVTPAEPALALSELAQLADPSLRHLAMGHPDSVPAGVYGRQWLERIGLWNAVQPKVVPMQTVRAALAAVREGRAEAAIVYATDARMAPELRIAYTVAASEGPSIVYPAAVIRGGNEAAARRFLDFLQSVDARRVFEAAGFGVAAGD